MKLLKKKNEEGAALVEYSLLIAGVALISAAAVSVFGHKTSDLVAATATVLPGAHDDDNGPIVSGKLIETTEPAAGSAISVDMNTIATTNLATPRLGNNILGTNANTTAVAGVSNVLGTLVVEAADN